MILQMNSWLDYYNTHQFQPLFLRKGGKTMDSGSLVVNKTLELTMEFW